MDELAREWRQHRGTIYRKVAAGEIPSIRLGGESAALRIPRSALEKVYEASAVGHGSSAEQAVGQ
ncbi:MAG: helix-turn-helix domain-containing protein [Actinomycetota bacterium]